MRRSTPADAMSHNPANGTGSNDNETSAVRAAEFPSMGMSRACDAFIQRALLGDDLVPSKPGRVTTYQVLRISRPDERSYAFRPHLNRAIGKHYPRTSGLEDFRHAADAGRRNRRATSHRLEHNVWPALAKGRQSENIRCGIRDAQFRL